MIRIRTLCLALFAGLCIASSARADIPGPDGRATRHPWGYGAPPPGWFEANALQNPLPPVDATPPAPQQQQGPADVSIWRPTPRPEPSPRTGPFRSCGSGAGVGFAGIGIAWGLMWIGCRFAGRIARK